MNVVKSKIFWFGFIIVLLLLWQIVSLNPDQYLKKTTEFNITDDCGKSLNSVVLHTIDSDTLCELECRNLCGTLNKDIKNIVYKDAKVGCNSCKCYCR